MLGDLKFCSMFVPLCSSVCFRNVGCWHVPVLGPVVLLQGSKKRATVWGINVFSCSWDSPLLGYIESL